MSQNGINEKVLEVLAPNVMQGRVRRNVKRVDSTEVQGEGSWVEVTGATWGEAKRMGAEIAALAGDNIAQAAVSEKMIVAHVVGWNWIADREGELPVPKDDPTVLDELTSEEMAFLGSAITGQNVPKP